MKELVSIVVAMVLLSACGGKQNANSISSDTGVAESVYLTHDEHGNAVIVWTERSDRDLALSFATLPRGGQSFSKVTRIPLTPDVATHAEGMPKVAFKDDGAIIVAYEKKAPTRANKYASAICFVMSNDGGRSWSKEAFLHSDTVSGKSRSYFDIERLPDGEIGASWLDVRLTASTDGRSVRFAKTSSSRGFSDEIVIDSSACQCCRIDVYTDESQDIFVAYRGLKKGILGKQIRDMMIATSTDRGKTFSAPITISADQWNIDGCPHTGPSICGNKAELISLWYTEGSGTGIYYARKKENESGFAPRQLVSADGHHPQLSAAGNGIAMVWEENAENNGVLRTVIRYRIVRDGTDIENGTLTPPDVNAFLPVVTPTQDGFLVAYLMERGSHARVYWTML